MCTLSLYNISAKTVTDVEGDLHFNPCFAYTTKFQPLERYGPCTCKGGSDLQQGVRHLGYQTSLPQVWKPELGTCGY